MAKNMKLILVSAVLEHPKTVHFALCLQERVQKSPEELQLTTDANAVICATGFVVTFAPQFKLYGLDDTELQHLWSTSEPLSYLSLCAPKMPNYFTFGGPNAVIAHGSLIEAFNWTADYIVRVISKMATENIQSICVKDTALAEFNDYADEVLRRLVWTEVSHKLLCWRLLLLNFTFHFISAFVGLITFGN